MRDSPNNMSQFDELEILEMYKAQRRVGLDPPKVGSNNENLKASGATQGITQNLALLSSIKKGMERKLTDIRSRKQIKVLEPEMPGSPTLQRQGTNPSPSLSELVPKAKRALDNSREESKVDAPISSAGLSNINSKQAILSAQEELDRAAEHLRSKAFASYTFYEVAAVLLRLKYAMKVKNAVERIPDVLYNFLKLMLGPLIRELGQWSVFGERALEGETLRTASVAAVTECWMLTLEATEYWALLKARAKEKKNEKNRMIYNCFGGTEKLDYETFWQFQFMLSRTFGKENDMLGEDHKRNNKVVLISRGVVEVSKARHHKTMAEFDQTLEDLEPVVRRFKRLQSSLDHLRTQVDGMPDNGHRSKYLLGFLGEGQLVNLESLFTTSGRTLFNYRIKSPTIEYYEMNQTSAKQYLAGHLLENMVNSICGVLDYRTAYIANKNAITRSGEAIPPGGAGSSLDGLITNQIFARTVAMEGHTGYNLSKPLEDASGTIRVGKEMTTFELRKQLADISPQYQQIPLIMKPRYKKFVEEYRKIKAEEDKAHGDNPNQITRKQIKHLGGITKIRGAKDFTSSDDGYLKNTSQVTKSRRLGSVRKPQTPNPKPKLDKSTGIVAAIIQ